MISCHNRSLCTVRRASSVICGVGGSVAEIMAQAVVTFNDLTGEIHENQKTDFHFFLSLRSMPTSITDRFLRRQHLHIPEIPNKRGLLAGRPCWRV